MISAVNLNKAWYYAKRGIKMAPDFALGTGGEAFEKSLREAVRGVKGADGKYTGGTGYKNFWTKLKNAFKASETHNQNLIQSEGGFFKAMKKNLMEIPSSLKNGWKLGGETAKAAGKSSFWGSIKGVSKSLYSKMPLIGSILFVAMETPNIVKATLDGGIVDGAAEFVKAGTRATASMAGFCIGQALCPIPIVGGIIGGMVADWAASKIVGKSYSEKKTEEQEKLAQMQQMPKGFDTGTTNPFAMGNMTADQYMAQQLQAQMMNNPELFAQQYAMNSRF